MTMTAKRIEDLSEKIDAEVAGLIGIETDQHGEKSKPVSAEDFFDLDAKKEILLDIIKLEEPAELDPITAERIVRQTFYQKLMQTRTNQNATVKIMDIDGDLLDTEQFRNIVGRNF